MNKTCRLRGRW